MSKKSPVKRTPVKGPKPDQRQSKFTPDDDGRIVHGAYSERMRQRYSDERTAEGRQLKATMDALVNDLGGNENLTSDQRINLDSVRSLLIVLRRIGEFVDRQESIIKDGQLLPVLGKNYLGYLNSLRLTLDQLFKDRGSSGSLSCPPSLAGSRLTAGAKTCSTSVQEAAPGPRKRLPRHRLSVAAEAAKVPL